MSNRYHVFSGRAGNDQELAEKINDIVGDDYDVVSLETRYVETGAEYWRSTVIQFRVLAALRD